MTVTLPVASLGTVISIIALSPTVMFSTVTVTLEGALDALNVLFALAAVYLSSPRYLAVTL